MRSFASKKLVELITRQMMKAFTSNDPAQVFESAVAWLRTASVLEEDVIASTYSMVAAFHWPMDVRHELFTAVGSHVALLSSDQDEFLQYFLNAIVAPNGENVNAALSIVEALLSKGVSLAPWWFEWFTKDIRHLLVEKLSDHGLWLQATCLALELVPKEVDLGYPDWLSLKVFDKVIARATRFRLDSKEARLVVDVTSASAETRLKQALEELTTRLGAYLQDMARNEKLLQTLPRV